MARRGRTTPAPRRPEPRPAPLPPERRTLGQLVAETIRFYQGHFFQSLPLGISVAAITQLTFAFGHRHVEPRGHPPAEVVPRAEVPPRRRSRDLDHAGRAAPHRVVPRGLRARHGRAPRRPAGSRGRYGIGVLVFIPAPLLAAVLGLLALPALAYLAFFAWVVPAALVEGKGFRESFKRSIRLGRADYVHALGGLATLVILFYVVRLMLALLLRGGGEITERSAVVSRRPRALADALPRLGPALSRPVREGETTLRTPTEGGVNAEVRDAVHPDAEGDADAPGQPGPAARGQQGREGARRDRPAPVGDDRRLRLPEHHRGARREDDGEDLGRARRAGKHASSRPSSSSRSTSCSSSSPSSCSSSSPGTPSRP